MLESSLMFVIFTPLLIIFWLANLAERRRTQAQDGRILALVAYALMALILIFNWSSTAFPSAATPVDSPLLLQVGTGAITLLGLLALLPPVRRFVANFIAIDPASTLHALALALAALVLTSTIGTVAMGLENVAQRTEDLAASGFRPDSLAALWTQQLLTALLALIGVGWLTRRSWGATWQRLGVERPTPKQIGLGIGLGLILVPVEILLSTLFGALGIGYPAGFEKLVEQLMGGLASTPFGVFTAGVSAALGEESIFRGALQPRFGLVLTTFIFVLAHAQYGLSVATLVLIVIGGVLGIVRQRTNTTTCMIIHAVYNITISLLAYLGVGS